MREAFALALTQIRKIWLNRMYAIPVAVVACIVGWVVVAMLPDVYEGTATVYVDTQSTLTKALDRIAVDTGDLDASFVALARQRLLSRPNLERLARETDLDINAHSASQTDALLANIAKNITVEAQSTHAADDGRKRDNIFAIKFTHKNAATAKKMVSALLDVFNESVLGATRQGDDQTEKFLDEQIQLYQAKLTRTEATLKDFKLRNAASMPAEGRSYYQMLQDVRDSAGSASLELRQAQHQRDELRQQISALTGGARSDSKISADQLNKLQQYERLHRQLDELLVQYTDEHPEVVAVRRRIKELGVDPKTLPRGDGNAPMAQSDVTTIVSQLRIELSKTEATVAALSEKASALAGREQHLATSANGVPEVEAQLQDLTRDYEVNKSQYASLMQRREAARLAREAGRSNDSASFQIIEPPHAGTQPVGPLRGLLLTAVLAGGLALGAAVGFLLSQLRPTFGDIHELNQLTQLNVLGSIGMVRDARLTTRHRIEYLVYAAVLLLLVLTYVYLLYAMADDFKIIVHTLIG